LDRAAASTTAPRRAGCGIGVFDSGVGGLTVLRELHARLPEAELTYIGDVSHAPYGEHSAQRVRARCEHLVAHLVDRGAGLVVVACNTATAAVLEALRARWPDVAFVGVEPGIRPAAQRTRSGRIAVLATSVTAGSARLRALIQRHAAHLHVHVHPCPGLATAIEHGAADWAALAPTLAPACDAVRASGADTVVLGCTHYPLISRVLRRALPPGTALIDTAPAVAARAAALWAPTAAGPRGVRVLSTGATAAMRRVLSRCEGLESVTVQPTSL
jgi:glutamate racemase